jgi:hypothetical protein
MVGDRFGNVLMNRLDDRIQERSLQQQLIKRPLPLGSHERPLPLMSYQERPLPMVGDSSGGN